MDLVRILDGAAVDGQEIDTALLRGLDEPAPQLCRVILGKVADQKAYGEAARAHLSSLDWEPRTVNKGARAADIPVHDGSAHPRQNWRLAALALSARGR